MVFKADLTASALEPTLRRWLQVEPDEFTRSAIEGALASRSPQAVVRPVSRVSGAQIVEAYRYVADRLCHQVRNALYLPNAQLARFQRVVADVQEPALRQELTEVLAGFQSGLFRVSRSVEFDTGDDYLQFRDISLLEWLGSAARDFEARFGPALFAVACDPVVRRARLRANGLLLDTIFGNIWSNAVQATDAPHSITIQAALDSVHQRLELTILDNGPGFTDAHLETAFQQVFSNKAGNRGRGLLEIADAVVKLQGSVQLARIGTGDFRILIALPADVR